MLMTVVINEAIGQLRPELQEGIRDGSLEVLLYADDTLLIGLDGPQLQHLLDTVAEVGSRYGMALHWSKFQLLQINGKYELRSPNGETIPAASRMAYLGASMYDDGRLKRELNQKLGVAWGDFSKLDRLWRRTSLPVCRKVAILQSVVVSRLLYGLSSAWLNQADMRRLNGFYCRCLRVILKIKPAYISRISNADVLAKAYQKKLGHQLLKQQLLLYGRIARAPLGDTLRRLTFCPGSLRPISDRFIRRVGRPRNEWVLMVQKKSFKVSSRTDQLIHSAVEWKNAVLRYVDRLT